MQPKFACALAVLVQMALAAPMKACTMRSDSNSHSLLKRSRMASKLRGKFDLGDACVAGGTAVLGTEACLGYQMYKGEQEFQRKQQAEQEGLEVAAGRAPEPQKPKPKKESSGTSYPAWTSA
ncbi:hypothetical protein PpBr36_06902 [Pyricularia pennisetigena]|uniref:hypothetical protein n=1 Tax=Pyricularia pennisetigena TaxID=1578925 RepID=UPI001154BF6B|nr:hypothetical protein PpBr36_06902 [Pyricularia pennisetigena]TLS25060.1 hypothetical protein PpBr36_06902 [Pyricularia pennisetigena]